MNNYEVIQPIKIEIPSDNDEKVIFWKEQIHGWIKSKKTKIEYCRTRGLNEGQFSYWCKKLKRMSSSPSPQVKKTIPVDMKVMPNRIIPPIRINRTDGTVIEIPILADTDLLKKVMEAVIC